MGFTGKSWHNADAKIREILENRLAAGNDDPFFVFNVKDVEAKLKFWNEKFPRVKPFYAMKANHTDFAIKTLAKLGAGFDCASKNEIERILDLGVDPERIIYANPAKQPSHLRFAQQNGVYKMTFDNIEELLKIKEIFKDMELNLIGICFHAGSNLDEPAIFYPAIAACRRLFDFSASIGQKLNFLDIGGGFSGNDANQVESCAKHVNKALDDFFPEDSIEIISEPGRYFSLTAMRRIVHINLRKIQRSANGEISHINYFINEGLFSTFMGCYIFNLIFIPRPLVAPKFDASKSYDTTFWGQSLDSSDKIFEIKFPELHVGDWIIFDDHGSYGFCCATTFNGFPLPDVLLIEP